VRSAVRAGGTPGPAGSIGKVHQGSLNQRLQRLACELLGADAIAWDGPDADLDAWAGAMPFETRAMLRSRANTIEGGTTEVNKNILAEKVLGLPREPDSYLESPWEEVPRS
jgi:alkylation response protein AidB-like acyl-CoA dehydrogenase